MALNKNAKKWVKALRSRKYKQITGRLKDVETNRFCCLGVACELAVKAGIVPAADRNGGYAGDLYSLPEDVRVWLGLAYTNGSYESKQHGNTDLAEDNDARGKKFYQIARLIESEPEGMFE